MDRTYERRKREESRWLRFVARQTAAEARRLREQCLRIQEESRLLREMREPRRFLL